MATISFNAAEVQPSSFDALPAGTYEAVIANSEAKPMKSGNGMGFNFEFEIISGDCKGRKVFSWITFEHRTSPDAQRIGREQLSAICRAVGVQQLNDTAPVHNLQGILRKGLPAMLFLPRVHLHTLAARSSLWPQNPYDKMCAPQMDSLHRKG